MIHRREQKSELPSPMMPPSINPVFKTLVHPKIQAVTSPTGSNNSANLARAGSWSILNPRSLLSGVSDGSNSGVALKREPTTTPPHTPGQEAPFPGSIAVPGGPKPRSVPRSPRQRRAAIRSEWSMTLTHENPGGSGGGRQNSSPMLAQALSPTRGRRTSLISVPSFGSEQHGPRVTITFATLPGSRRPLTSALPQDSSKRPGPPPPERKLPLVGLHDPFQSQE